MSDTDGSSTKGGEIIRGYARTLPGEPGVYRMFDGKGRLLYVGKAAHLKNRVSSYGRASGHSARIARMISQTVHMEFTVTQTETEALLLEATLIKRLKPLYNISLRDDKSFPYIYIDQTHPYSRLLKHRGARTQKGVYFGPFASARAVNHLLKVLEKAFLVRTCSDSIFQNRTRPCLLYHIKRCSGPCTGNISQQEHEQLSEDMVLFLKGKGEALEAKLTQEMRAASDRQDFERASVFRDRRAALSLLRDKQGVHPQTIEEADVFAVVVENGQVCVEVFFIRARQNWGNHAFFPKIYGTLREADVLAAFLPQFYLNKPIAKCLLLSHDLGEEGALLARALEVQSGHRVEIQTPKRGEKYAMVAYALKNAQQSLARKRAEQRSHGEMREGLARLFHLKKTPERIEIYDNSHIQGSHPVGVMVVFGPEGPMKSAYRKFSITQADGKGDDYGMMEEVFTRRFTKALEGDDSQRPDLVVIDGGRGQLSQALNVLKTLGVYDIPLVGMAKGVDRHAGREYFYTPDAPPFQLPSNDPVLYYLQNMRDEAHRFAISSHRLKRSKGMKEATLEAIPGVGPRKRQDLLKRFGSLAGLREASLEELKEVSGISPRLAGKIYDFFHE